MKRNIFLRQAVFVIQPLLFWLGATPDGLIYDKNSVITLVYSKLNALPTEEILRQQIFSVISLSVFSKTKMARFY